MKLVSSKHEDWASIQLLTLSVLIFLFTLPRCQVIFQWEQTKEKLGNPTCVNDYDHVYGLCSFYDHEVLRNIKKPSKPSHFMIGNSKVGAKSSGKLLKICVDNQLSLNQHFSNICKTASKQLNEFKAKKILSIFSFYQILVIVILFVWSRQLNH